MNRKGAEDICAYCVKNPWRDFQDLLDQPGATNLPENGDKICPIAGILMIFRAKSRDFSDLHEKIKPYRRKPPKNNNLFEFKILLI